MTGVGVVATLAGEPARSETAGRLIPRRPQPWLLVPEAYLTARSSQGSLGAGF
jgi:hypothetical protein